MGKKIAFYAPIKPPDHPIASGDRLIARNIIRALDLAGFSVELASSFIAYSKRHDKDILKTRKEQAIEESQRVIRTFADAPPDLWLTYHPYCKAPDWIGPRVAKEFDIPYVNVEACRTGQGRENGNDLWQNWREEAQHGMSAATRHFYFKPNDREYLQTWIEAEKFRNITPFIDSHPPDTLPSINLPTDRKGPTLVTVAMMRPGKKLENYQILAKALTPLQSLDWNLIIVGDGPQSSNIRTAFASFDPARLHWTGQVEESRVLSYMDQADIFVWPGWQEPIGMVYLEAQMMGLPIVAQDSQGVPLVVRHDETGLLVPQASIDDEQTALSDALTRLILDMDLRKKFGTQGVERVETHHSLRSASQFFQKELNELVD